MPHITGVLETSLYVYDVAESAAFYEQVFGFNRLSQDERFCALAVKDGQVLLLFQRGGATESMPTPGGVIPNHDGRGQLHLAFSITAAELPEWESHLATKRVAIESRVHWDRGGDSIYFRDPDGHLIELATPGIWPNY